MHLCNIRKAEKKDWIYIKEIFEESIAAGVSTFRSRVPSYEEWDAQTDSECRLVCEKDGRVIAFASMAPFSAIPAYSGVAETSIYVSEEERGGGTGTKLLSRMIEESEKRGFWSLYAKIIADNQASIALHTKCGFRKVGYREKIAKDIFGNWKDIVEFERRSGKIY